MLPNFTCGVARCPTSRHQKSPFLLHLFVKIFPAVRWEIIKKGVKSLKGLTPLPFLEGEGQGWGRNEEIVTPPRPSATPPLKGAESTASQLPSHSLKGNCPLAAEQLGRALLDGGQGAGVGVGMKPVCSGGF